MPPTQPRESELTRTEPLRLYQLIREPSSTGVTTTHPGRTSASSSTRTLDSNFSTDTRARRVPLWQEGRRRRVPGITADAAIPTHRVGRTALHRSNTFRNWDGSVPEVVLRHSSQRMSAIELEARYQSYLQNTPAVTFPVASSNSLPQTTSASVNTLHPDRPPYLLPMRRTNNSDEGNGARRQYGRSMSIPFSPLRDVEGQLESAAVEHTRSPDLADFVHPEFSFTHRGVPDLAASDRHELSEVEQQRMRQTVDPYSLPLTFPLLPSPRRPRAESIPIALRSHYGSIAAGPEPAFNLPWFTPGPYFEIPRPLVRSGPLVDVDSSEASSGTSRAEARTWLRLGGRHADRLRALVHPRTPAEQARADTARSTAPYLYAESLEIIEGLIGAMQGVLDSDAILVDHTVEAVTERAETETDSDDGSLPPRDIGECVGDTEGNNLDSHCYARWIGLGWRCYFCRREM